MPGANSEGRVQDEMEFESLLRLAAFSEALRALRRSSGTGEDERDHAGKKEKPAREEIEKKPMKVKDAMTGTAYYCQLDTNLGSATERMWVGNCGFLPVMGPDGKIIGVVTDRDICIALGTRNRLPGDITVGEVMSDRLFACSPDDDVHIALQLMQEGGVRRLPVIGANGALVGVISMDDLLVQAEAPGIGRRPELSIEEVLRTYRAIDQHRVRQVVLARGAA